MEFQSAGMAASSWEIIFIKYAHPVKMLTDLRLLSSEV
jgi:hypothetical protein